MLLTCLSEIVLYENKKQTSKKIVIDWVCVCVCVFELKAMCMSKTSTVCVCGVCFVWFVVCVVVLV